MEEHQFRNAQRVVVKLGSNVITAENDLNLEVIETVSDQVSQLMRRGMEVILVSSGAMAAGMRKMKMTRRPNEIPKRQAISAIGQSSVMHAYERSFAKNGILTAQMLLTGDDLTNRKRYLNSRNNLQTLIDWKIVPIINENDSIMVEEIKVGDNDNLAAMITLLMDADFLCILTDIDGLYNKDPRQFHDAEIIPRVEEFHKEIDEIASNIPGTLGTGGMLSKIQAAKKVTSAGIPMIITKGDTDNVLLRLYDGEELGTYFVPKERKMTSRKCWIAHTVAPKGTITIDDGAVHAVGQKGKSLLPIGIVSVTGKFDEGDAVDFRSSNDVVLGVGLVNYSSSDIRLIKGLKSYQIKACLGESHHDEIIHRNNLVLKNA